MRFILAFLLMTTPALAAQCGQHDDVVAVLKRSFGELPIDQGVSDDGRLMQIYANRETGTWTAVMTKPDGTACLVAGGKEFQAAPQGDPA